MPHAEPVKAAATPGAGDGFGIRHLEFAAAAFLGGFPDRCKKAENTDDYGGHGN